MECNQNLFIKHEKLACILTSLLVMAAIKECDLTTSLTLLKAKQNVPAMAMASPRSGILLSSAKNRVL
jgi:hypothetical protein